MKMNNIVLCSALLFTFLYSNAQKNGNSKIIVQVKDTSSLYKRIKFAFIRNDFIVKDLEIDTIQTYPREFLDNQYLIATAIINGNYVTLSGVYGSRKVNFFGGQTSAKDFKKVVYYKGSVEWRLLLSVAAKLDGEFFFDD